MSANPPAHARSISDSQALADAERSGGPFLVFSDPDERQHLFFFPPGSASVSVGRRQSSDLALEWDHQVSRLHARFELIEDAWTLVDEGLSSNGTFVNDERLSGRRRLNDRDALRFGTTRVTFRSPDSTAEVTETPAAVGLSTTQRRVLTALCRPYKGASGFASPATDEQIADELILSVGAVRGHLRVLSAKLGVEDLPHAETRVRLVERAFSVGLISDRDL